MTRDSGEFYVYVLFRSDTGVPFYIGKGKGNRIREHFYLDGKNPHKDSIIRKAGGRVPYVKVRQDLDETAAFETEMALIKALGREPNGPLVNLTDGGEGASGYKHSAAAIEAMRAPKSDEHKQKLSESLKGRIVPEEEKEKLRKPKIVRRLTSTKHKLREALTGKTLSLETRAKISAARRGTKVSEETRLKMSVARMGRPSPAKGYKWTAAQKEALRLVRNAHIL